MIDFSNILNGLEAQVKNLDNLINGGMKGMNETEMKLMAEARKDINNALQCVKDGDLTKINELTKKYADKDNK